MYDFPMRRPIVKLIAILAILAAVAAGGAYHYLRRSLPLATGEIIVPGTTAPIEIVRDADAIPHVLAANKRDALFGLGYVHAQDRLWQMEFQRRIGFGRLSEIFGKAAIPQDRFLRTVGFGRAARAAWDRMPARATDQINAYLAGVNAFIATHHGAQLPPEFTLLGFEPEPFAGPDVAVWTKMMAWDLSANYTFELLRDDLVKAVGPERMAELMPPYGIRSLSITDPDQGTEGGESHENLPNFHRATGAPTVSARTSLGSALAALSSGDRSVAGFLLGNARVEGLGSNNWVVDGTMTASGRPMLANDPHLSAKTPSTWYLAHVSGGDFEVIGATLPGTPAVAIGRNRFIAWGETNVAADVQDLYRERPDAAGTSVEFRGAQEPMRTIAERIAVKGGAPIDLTVRLTRHGPLISDALNAINAESTKTPKPAPLEPLAFRWTALDDDDTTLQSFLALNEAHNWEQFTGALREFIAPSQNFVFADVAGHIGYYAPGRIPVRASGDGSRPTDGWTGDSEWVGHVPFESLPHLYDPPNHFIVTANHRPAPADYRYNLGLEWTEPFRAARIVEMLRGKATFTPDDFARMQADTRSPHAAQLLPLLLRLAKPANDTDKEAIAILSRWNLDARAGSAAAAIFSAWFLHLAPALAGDELGPVALDSYAGRFSFVSRFLVNVLSSGHSPWCDDVRTPATESCSDTVTAALRKGVGDLSATLGGDMAGWRWDAVHRAMFPHQGLDAVPALRPLLSRSVPNGGDWSTVNVGPVAADHLYEQRSVAGYRQIVDLSQVNDSRFLDAVGESGHFLSPHYDDFLDDWQHVRYRKMRMERADIDAGAIGHLRLLPDQRLR
jgi:penicillin amidase